VSKHATRGTAQNIVTELGKEDNGKHHVYTDQQLRYLKKKKAAGTDAEAYVEKEKTNSERLIDALDQKVAEKKIRCVRLMHKVTETSLLAVSKAQMIAECEKEKLREALERAKTNGRDPDDIPDSERKKFEKLAMGEILEVAAELSLPSHDLLMTYSVFNGPDADEQEMPFQLDVGDP